MTARAVLTTVRFRWSTSTERRSSGALRRPEGRPMRIDTQTIQSLNVQSLASSEAMPEQAFGAAAAGWAAIVATVVVATAAVLLASGLAVAMSLT
jgi:hypothetical protein